MSQEHLITSGHLLWLCFLCFALGLSLGVLLILQWLRPQIRQMRSNFARVETELRELLRK